MSYYSDVTILAKKQAYEMLKTAWEAIGLVPDMEGYSQKENCMVIRFEHRNYFKSVAMHLVQVMRQIEKENGDGYAMRVTITSEDNSSEELMNETAEQIFMDYGVNVTVLYPNDTVEIDKTERKDSALIKISYSWGDTDHDIPCKTKALAWKLAEELALREKETASFEHDDCAITITFDKANWKIILHYSYDNTYCYFDIVDNEK